MFTPSLTLYPLGLPKFQKINLMLGWFLWIVCFLCFRVMFMVHNYSWQCILVWTTLTITIKVPFLTCLRYFALNSAFLILILRSLSFLLGCLGLCTLAQSYNFNSPRLFTLNLFSESLWWAQWWICRPRDSD